MMTPGKGGVLPSQAIHECTRNGIIRARNAIDKAQIQPASLDLQLGGRAHWLQASFLPGPDSLVEDKLDALSMATIGTADACTSSSSRNTSRSRRCCAHARIPRAPRDASTCSRAW